MAISIRRMLFPVDFSDSSDHALRYAAALARKLGARLDLLHVVEEIVITQHMTVSVPHTEDLMVKLLEEAKERTESLLGARFLRGLRTSSTVVRGTPFLEIIQTAREKKSDLVVMGTHGRTGLSHMLMGSTAEKVVRKSPCPVLTVKHPEHRFEHP